MFPYFLLECGKVDVGEEVASMRKPSIYIR